jgi:dolichol-phosphate mannosyltransferase
MPEAWGAPSSKPYVVVPTYDEAENIESVVRQILDSVSNAKVLVVDDSSPDGTAEIVQKLKEDGLAVEVMVRPEKAGLGSAYRSGFARALADGASSCVEIDADLSHDPAKIPLLLQALDRGAALAIGSRYVAGGRSPGLSRGRLLISRGGNYYAALTLGLNVRDATAGFRAYRREALLQIDLANVRADGYGFQVEMAYLVHRNKGTIEEIPITFRDRVAGGSKMSSRIVIEAMLLCSLWGLARIVPYFERVEVQEQVVRIFNVAYRRLEKVASLSRPSKRV